MGRVVVSGRFLAQDTPSARHARALTVAMADRLFDQLHLALPEVGVVPAPTALRADVPRRWQGVPGLAWEQTDLPTLLEREDVLVSLTGTGPPRRRHILAIPEPEPADPVNDDPQLADFVRRTQPGTARRAAAVVAMSEARAKTLRDEAGLRNVHVIPVGIDEAFTSSRLDQTTARGFRPYALGIGAHEHASRLDWLALRWKLLRNDTPLNLVLTTSSRTSEAPPRLPAGVHVVVDPNDHYLAQLYANAEMLVFPGALSGASDPSSPLLRALAAGTPFLATDTAEARAVAVSPEVQLIDLAAFEARHGNPADDEWATRMLSWSKGPPVSREACRSKAAQYTWTAAAGQLVNLARQVAN